MLIKATVQSVRGLDQMAAQTSAGLQITLNDGKPLADLKDALARGQAGPGTGQDRGARRRSHPEGSAMLDCRAPFGRSQ